MTQTPAPRTVLFPGSFAPFTKGHASLVGRALGLFDKVVIAIGFNAAKQSAANVEERIAAISAIYASEPRVSVMAYSGLTVDACKAEGAGWMLRGVRTVADFEYERNLADLNRMISGIETVILFTLPELAAVSSSAVRELKSHGYDVSSMLP